jgi:hypothetical protein
MRFTAICVVLGLVLATRAPSSTPSAKPTQDPQTPVILSIKLDRTDVRGGDIVSGMVLTSPSVASVEARIGGFGIGVPKVAPGRFALTYTVPYLPWFWHRGYAFDIIARNTAGEATHRSVTINIH